MEKIPYSVDNIQKPEASSEGWIQRFHNSMRFGIKEAALAALITLAPGCKCADDPNNEAPEHFKDSWDTPEKAVKDIEQAAETVEIIWKEMWESIEFLQEGYNTYKDMSKDEILRNPTEFKNFAQQADDHLEKITDAASKLRANGIRVNPGLTQYPLELVARLQQKIWSANKNRKVVKGLAFLGKFVDFDITKKAVVGESVLKAVDGVSGPLYSLKLTLESLEDRRLPVEVNNGTLTAALKAFKSTNAYKQSDIKIDLEHPPEIPIGLEKGDEGLEVAVLQSYLIDQGYLLPGKDDGKFDSKTEKALTQFHQDFDIYSPGMEGASEVMKRRDPERGRVQRGTLAELREFDKIMKEKPCTAGFGLHSGLRGPDVEQLQQRLIELDKMRLGGDDGKFGSGTKGSLSSFQRGCLSWLRPEINLLKPSQIGRVDLYTCRGLEKPENLCSDAFLKKRGMERAKE